MKVRDAGKIPEHGPAMSKNSDKKGIAYGLQAVGDMVGSGEQSLAVVLSAREHSTTWHEQSSKYSNNTRRGSETNINHKHNYIMFFVTSTFTQRWLTLKARSLKNIL